MGYSTDFTGVLKFNKEQRDMTNNKTWEELSRLEMHDQESSGCSVCLAEMMGGKNMEILREYISTLLSKERGEREAFYKALLDSIDSLPDMIHPTTLEDYKKLWRMVVIRINKSKSLIKSKGIKLDAVGSVDNDKTAVQQKNEIIDKINEKKDEVRKTEGAFKYDWCFEDCIKIIKKHK